jgi:hypothetical protein
MNVAAAEQIDVDALEEAPDTGVPDVQKEDEPMIDLVDDSDHHLRHSPDVIDLVNDEDLNSGSSSASDQDFDEEEHETSSKHMSLPRGRHLRPSNVFESQLDLTSIDRL